MEIMICELFGDKYPEIVEQVKGMETADMNIQNSIQEVLGAEAMCSQEEELVAKQKELDSLLLQGTYQWFSRKAAKKGQIRIVGTRWVMALRDAGWKARFVMKDFAGSKSVLDTRFFA